MTTFNFKNKVISSIRISVSNGLEIIDNLVVLNR